MWAGARSRRAGAGACGSRRYPAATVDRGKHFDVGQEARQECSTMQPPNQSSPSEEQGSIQYYVLEGLFPSTHVFALNLALGTFLHLYWEEQLPYPLGLGEQQLTERERDLLRPLLAHYPQFAPYEVIHASYFEGFDRLSEQLIAQAQAKLETLREEKLWDAQRRPIHNVMARLRLKVREVGLDTVNMLETGYMLIKNPKWRSPLEKRHTPG